MSLLVELLSLPDVFMNAIVYRNMYLCLSVFVDHLSLVKLTSAKRIFLADIVVTLLWMTLARFLSLSPFLFVPVEIMVVPILGQLLVVGMIALWHVSLPSNLLFPILAVPSVGRLCFPVVVRIMVGLTRLVVIPLAVREYPKQQRLNHRTRPMFRSHQRVQVKTPSVI